MTDKENLEQLFTEFGIGYEVDPKFLDLGKEIENKEGSLMIVCSEGDAKIKGYTNFFTVFEFDKNGKFIEMGAWE